MRARNLLWALAAVTVSVGITWEELACGDAGGLNVWQPELLARVEEGWRARALEIARSPQLQLRGVPESFPCRWEIYTWLLDHPDWGYRLWEELGARGARVSRIEDGSFVGQDDQGNRLNWRTIYQQQGQRLWYVEAQGRGNVFQQPVRVRALLLLEYQSVRSPSGNQGIRHCTDLAAQLDSPGWKLLLRLGPQAGVAYARHCLEQVQIFFAGLAWYMSEHPVWAQQRLRSAMRDQPETDKTGRELLRILSEASASQ